MITYENWHCTIDSNNIFWASLDRKGTAVNTLTPVILQELEMIIDSINRQKNCVALIIKSSKESFIAGADINLFKSISSMEEANQFILYGQSVYTKLEQMTIPTIAVIQGFCLGGGLELALSCQFRICEASDKTVLGLPEVKLGITPGWGGTSRLPKLIGIFNAMDLILSGRSVRAKQAQKMGLVQWVVPKRLLDQVAVKVALGSPDVKIPSNKFQKMMNTVCNQPLARHLLANLFRYKLKKKVQYEHYPAPFEIINHWEKCGIMDERVMQEEARLIARLLVSSTSKELVHVFSLQEKLKGLASKNKNKMKAVHVIGAGTMGGDIAAWCALHGFEVTLQDQSPALLASALKRAAALSNKRLEKHLAQKMMDRLMPDPLGLGLARADIVIEAITEKLEAKQALFKKIESSVKPHTVLATNTSTIPIEQIAEVLVNPHRVIGFHFFNPVAKMPLVEIVQARKTERGVVERTMAFARAIDKLPLPVKSAPGFLVNRILLPYMLEAMLLLEEGVAMEVIDQAAVNFGMPVGPIELADMVGLDVCLAAGEKMAHYLDKPAPPMLKDLVAQGYLGCKTNRGFYHYKKGQLQKQKTPEIDPALSQNVANRLILKMVNEALACLKEGIVSDPDFIDAGSIFGFGFAPFRGGLMSYIDSQKR